MPRILSAKIRSPIVFLFIFTIIVILLSRDLKFQTFLINAKCYELFSIS